jgi:hypothetical protein
MITTTIMTGMIASREGCAGLGKQIPRGLTSPRDDKTNSFFVLMTTPTPSLSDDKKEEDRPECLSYIFW